MSTEEDVMESKPDELLIESISSPIAAELLDFCDEEGGAAAGDLFETSENQRDHLLLLPPFEDVSSSAAASSAPAADNSVSYYPVDNDASFSPFNSFYSLLEASPLPAPTAEQEPDLVRYNSSSSSSSNPLPCPPPPAAMFSLPPPAMFVADPFDHGGYPLDPTMVPPVSATGPPPQAAAYEEEIYGTAGGMPAVAAREMLGLEGAPTTTYGIILDGISMGAGAMYCDGMLEQPQGLFAGGMPALGLEAGGLLPPPPPPGGDAAESGSCLPPYGHDAMPGAYSSGDMKVIGGGSQHLMGGCIGNPPQMPSSDNMAASEDSSGKAGRLSPEERKEKIKRYLKKRNNRNFSKKIKYACRKTLADSRPRVRGRFAKNDELGEVTRLSSSSHEFDDDEEEMVIKEEDTIDSSEVFPPHMSSGINPFTYNYTVEPWTM